MSENFKEIILNELKDITDQTAMFKKELLGTIPQDKIVNFSTINKEEIETWKFRTLSLLKKILKDSDTRINEFKVIFFPEEKSTNIYEIYWPEYYNLRTAWVGTHFDRVLGILKSIENDINKGLFDGIEDLISADIFDSVLESAKYMNQSGFIRGAAVYGRVVLEQTLKKMCDKQNPPITYNSHTKASELNVELKKNKVLSTAEWRQIQTWLDIGNEAAHKLEIKFTSSEVVNLLNGLTAFIEKGI